LLITVALAVPPLETKTPPFEPEPKSVLATLSLRASAPEETNSLVLLRHELAERLY
jgi:hypothetical protein